MVSRKINIGSVLFTHNATGMDGESAHKINIAMLVVVYFL